MNIATIATLTAAIATAFIAAFTGFQIYREMAAEKRTRKEFAKSRAIDVMMQQVLNEQLTQEFSSLRDIIREYDWEPISFRKVVGAKGDEQEIADKAAYDTIITVLNYYESLAIATKHEAISDNILREWWQETLVLHWRLLDGFVNEFRHSRRSPSAFVEFEKLAKRWGK